MQIINFELCRNELKRPNQGIRRDLSVVDKNNIRPGEMVERLAYHIAKRTIIGWNDKVHWKMNSSNRHHYYNIARDTLLLLRQPEDYMTQAAEKADDPGSTIYDEPKVAVAHEDAWKIMIDAALNTKTLRTVPCIIPFR